MSNIIDVHNLTYEYASGMSVLNDISLHLAEGEKLALIGANGAGKSTLLQLILGLLVPKDGRIFYKGARLTKKTLPDLRKKVGFIFQNPDNQLFCNTIYDDIAFGIIKENDIDKRVSEILGRLNISHLKDRTPYKLSAGEKRLAAIAAVLIMKPELILMDEPSAELDPKARRNLISLINSLPESKIIATHDLDLASKTCKRVLVLHNGGITSFDNSILSNEKLLIEYGL